MQQPNSNLFPSINDFFRFFFFLVLWNFQPFLVLQSILLLKINGISTKILTKPTIKEEDNDKKNPNLSSIFTKSLVNILFLEFHIKLVSQTCANRNVREKEKKRLTNNVLYNINEMHNKE